MWYVIYCTYFRFIISRTSAFYEFKEWLASESRLLPGSICRTLVSPALFSTSLLRWPSIYLQLSCSWSSPITLLSIHLTWSHLFANWQNGHLGIMSQDQESWGRGLKFCRPYFLLRHSPAVHINDILYIETPSIHPQRGILRVQTQKTDQLPVGLITHLAEPALTTTQGMGPNSPQGRLVFFFPGFLFAAPPRSLMPWPFV